MDHVNNRWPWRGIMCKVSYIALTIWWRKTESNPSWLLTYYIFPFAKVRMRIVQYLKESFSQTKTVWKRGNLKAMLVIYNDRCLGLLGNFIKEKIVWRYGLSNFICEVPPKSSFLLSKPFTSIKLKMLVKP